MKLFQRTSLCFLALLLLFLSACGKDHNGDVTTGSAEGETAPPSLLSDLILIENGVTEYSLVVPQMDAETLSAAYAIRTLILKETGAKLQIVKDNNPQGTHEILLGKTNRPLSETVYANIQGPSDYCVMRADQTVAIAAGSSELLKATAETLLQQCYGKGVLKMPSDYRLEHFDNYLTLLKDGASDYAIVISRNNHADYDRAYYLQNIIRQATGVRIKILYDTVGEQEKEILFGSPDRSEITSVKENFETDLDYFVGVMGSKLVICTASDAAAPAAMTWFEENILYEGETLSVSPSVNHLYICRYELFSEIAHLLNNRVEGERERLESVEKVTVYSPTDSWWYSHHQAFSIINGVMVAVWTQGRFNENDCGQRIAISTSTDFVHWSETVPLIDTWHGEHSEMVLGMGGLYNDGETLTVYFKAGEYQKELLRENGTLRPVADGGQIGHGTWYVSTKDGYHWTEPQRMTVSGGGHQGPIPMGNGELLWAGGFHHAYTSDLSGLTWQGSASVSEELAIENGARMLVEGSFIVKDDVVYMFARSGVGVLYVSFSTDWGRTWSDPYKTNFTDANSKFMFGLLPDGRFYYVGNPVPGSDRNPLVLAISEDGLNFNEQYIIGDEVYQQRMDGMYKGGDYGYPNCFVGNDGYFYVVYSQDKEEIAVSRFLLSEIGINS